MKVVLINPPPGKAKGINAAMIMPPLGLLYLAAVLEQHGHEVQVIDAHLTGSDSRDIAESFKHKPDLIGLSTNITNYKKSIECSVALKDIYPDSFIVLGGPYISSLPGFDFRKFTAIDGIVKGEGERTLLEVASFLGDREKLMNVPGFIFSQTKGGICDKTRSLIEDLDCLPFPAYHLLPDFKKYKTRSRAWPVGFIFTSRGCSFRCTFCNRSIFGSTWRSHSAERVIREIDYMVGAYGIKQLDVLDDNFCYDIARTEKILDALIKSDYKLLINLQHGIRIDGINEEILIKMKKAGVFKIGFAIESADEAVQKSIRKKIDLRHSLRIVELARSLGIITHAFFMLGFPRDNPETMKKTIDFSIDMNPHFANFAICCPLPGTEIYEDVKHKGKFLQDMENGVESGFFGSRAFFETDSIKEKETVGYFKIAYKRFYVRIPKIMDILCSIKSLAELKWLFRALCDSVNIAIKNA